LSESFTSRGKGTPSISDDRKRTKPNRQKPIEYKDVAQDRDYANVTKRKKQKPTGQHELYLIASSFPRRNVADKGCDDFQQNKPPY
jgi:hypothetical protein